MRPLQLMLPCRPFIFPTAPVLRSIPRRIIAAATLMVLFIAPQLTAQTAPSPPLNESAHRATAAPSSPFRRATERSKAENLLKRARAAASDGNFELAIWYVDAADKLNVNYNSMFHKFADTPIKARTDIERMRATAAPRPGAVASQPAALPEQTGAMPSTEAVGRRVAPPTAADPQVSPAPATTSTNDKVEVASYSEESAPSTPTYYSNDFASEETEVRPSPISVVDPATASGIRSPASARHTVQPVDGSSIDTSELIARGTQLHESHGAADGAHAQWAVLRERSLSWLAESKAALDRGDLELAERYARAAQELRIPDSAYHPGDLRPWMLLMEISQQVRRFDPTGQYTANPQNGASQPQRQPSALDTAPASLAGGFDPISSIVGEPPVDGSSQRVTPAAAQQPVAPPFGGTQASPAPQSFPGIVNPFVNPNPAAPAGAVANAQYNGDGQNGFGPDMGSGPGPWPPVTNSQDGIDKLQSPTTPVPVVDLRSTRTGTGLAASDPTVPTTAPPPKPETEGMRLFREGRKALEARNLELAQEHFQKAWQLRQELDPTSVQQLQDHLQVLRATNGAELVETPVRSLTAPDSATSGAAKALVSQVTREQAAIRGLKESDPIGAWERLKKLKQSIAEADVEDTVRTQLQARVNEDSRDLESYITHHRAQLETEANNKAVLSEIDRLRQQRVRTEQMLAELTEQFNELMDQQRFSEAIVVAKKARELAPAEPVVQNMIEKSRVARQVVTSMLRNEKYQGAALAALNEVDSAGNPIEGSIEFPEARYWEDITSSRKKQLASQQRSLSAEELAIREALKRKIDVHFDQEPLSSVLNHIAQETGINVFLDPEGLTTEGLTSNTPVSLTLPRPISVRSALNLMLEPLHLSYVVDNEVLRITTEQVKQSKPIQRYYKVADLVIRIPNFVPNNDMGLPGALREAHNVASKSLQAAGAANQPLTIIADDPSLKPTLGNASVLAQMQAAGVYPGEPAPGAVATADTSLGGGALVDFDTLMQLIVTTVEPDTWEENGGSGTMAPFPTNLSLVISNTQEVHEKIVDLLEQLRQLQDLQITIEVRFITLNDSFFERIGVDFDFNIDDNTGLSVVDLQQLDDVGPSVTVGLDPTGTITPDLDIQFTQGSFGGSIPTFGGFTQGVGATVGFAILSDIEAFFLIEAAQGDTRTNVLQAPKVTLYDGQTASVSDVSQRPFVTSVIPVVADFAVGHQPVITVLTEGTTLSVQAVVSNDRRFVRLTLVPFFSSIGDVDTFTFIGRNDSDSGTAVEPTDENEPPERDNVRQLTEGTTVQLPTLAFTSVSTTVSVPDGGTILLGGIKRLSEGRNERGVPMLSKIPYVDRLFRNVGIGRDTQSLMMMVTPRIIIQEEEEQKLGLQ